jgi:hypothetical protein
MRTSLHGEKSRRGLNVNTLCLCDMPRFRLVLPNEKWVLGAPSEEHKDAWLHMLKNTIQTLPAKQKAESSLSSIPTSLPQATTADDMTKPVSSAADEYAAMAAAASTNTVPVAASPAVPAATSAPDVQQQAELYRKLDERAFGWQYLVSVCFLRSIRTV